MAAGLLCTLVLTGCGSSGSGESGQTSTEAVETQEAVEAEETQEAAEDEESQDEAADKDGDLAGDAEAIRVGSNRAMGTATPFVAQENGLLEESGLDIQVSEFSDGAALMEAFAAGELDIAIVGIGPVATWISKGVDMKIVASANGGGHVLMTRKETGIETVEDLKDHMVAEPGIATVTDAMLRSKILKEAGLDPEMDLTLIPGMKPADMASVLMATKEVDAMITWEPFAAQAEADYGDDIQVVYDCGKEIKDETGSDNFYPVNVVVASQDFIDNQMDQLKSFMEVYKETVDFINTDPEANSVLAKTLQMEESVVKAARDRVDYTYEIDEEASLETLQWSKDMGYIEEVPAAEDLFYEVQ